MTSGTSACIRNALELEITAHPAAANFGSSSRAMSVSSAAKIMLGISPVLFSGAAGETGSAATEDGMGVSSFHRTASPYDFRWNDRSQPATLPGTRDDSPGVG